MQNYTHYDNLLTGRCKDRRKLTNNTYAIRNDNSSIGIMLHETNVVTYHKNGRITLNSGGWKTPTTKDRINEFSPFWLWQNKGLWTFTSNGITSIFYDGVTIMKNGRIIKPLFEDRKHKRLMKLINTYCAKLKAFDKLPEPRNGDCLYCRTTTTGEVLGDIFNNHSHVLMHLKEKYVHGSLIVNALKWAGYRDEGIPIHYWMWGRENGPSKTSVLSAVRRYLKRQCGIA